MASSSSSSSSNGAAATTPAVVHDDDLTLYEYERKPRSLDAIRGKKLLISVEGLRGDFACPICLSLLGSTAMTLECSHRFCRKCIEQSLRMNGNDCPTCRERVATRRSLRDDKRFDQLIKELFGDTDVFERREDRAKANVEAIIAKRLAELKAKANASAASAAPAAKAATNAVADGEQVSSKPLSTEPSKKKRPAPVGLTNEDMLFVLRKHPFERLPAATKKEYIKANQRLTVAHMCQFLLQQYQSHYQSIAAAMRPESFQIVYHDTEGQEHALEDNDSLEDLAAKFKHGSRVADLVLHYKVLNT